MPFLPPNQQFQSIEGESFVLHLYLIGCYDGVDLYHILKDYYASAHQINGARGIMFSTCPFVSACVEFACPRSGIL